MNAGAKLSLSLASESLIMSHHYSLSCSGFPSVSVLFLRSYCTPLRHFMLLLRRIWLSLSVPMFLGELWGLLTNFCWSSQRTSLRTFARNFSNIDFFSENFTIERWWVSDVKTVMTFSRNFSNIHFFLKILPLKGDELMMSEMQKNGGSPTSFWREHARKNA